MWEVQPTMLRGAQNHAESETLPTIFEPPPASRQNRGSKASNKHEKRGKKVADQMDEQVQENGYKRNAKGRLAVQKRMTDLCNLENRIFRDNPLFDAWGRCQMTMEGASEIKQQQICEAAAACMDRLFLGAL